MRTCIIIDDEKNAREALEKIIQRYFSSQLQIVFIADSVKEGVFAINKYRPELVFLDIEMPEENGFKLFDYFDIYNFEVIFTTAYKQYAIDAIKFAALDYLLKPINYIDLRDVLTRLEKKQNKSPNTAQIEAFLSNLNHDPGNFNKIALPTLDGFQMEKVNNIVYCQAEESYTKIFTNRNEAILVARNLKNIEEMLPEELFFRIHKSHLVNMNYIKSYSKTDGYKIKLDNGIELDVATRRNDEFLKALTKDKRLKKE
ncbi:MAG: LytTR family DNA-binding domain-containing protein [Bacteroidales bacterium]|jgi:two-component system LytT family response regulator|nr:LytTR family DNA-binding domain-containing protein [Bacteroidales bacterium]